MYAASFSSTPKHEMRSGDGKDKITAAACIMIYLRALRCAARRFTAVVTFANVVASRYCLARTQPVLDVSMCGYATYTRTQTKIYAVRPQDDLLAYRDTATYSCGLLLVENETVIFNFI